MSSKDLEEEIEKKNPVLESAQKSAKRLLEQNKENPGVCAKIDARLTAISVPLGKLSASLTDKQGKLDRISEAVGKYEEEKAPLVQYLEETQNALDELRPFGIAIEEGEKQIDSLQVCNPLCY